MAMRTVEAERLFSFKHKSAILVYCLARPSTESNEQGSRIRTGLIDGVVERAFHGAAHYRLSPVSNSTPRATARRRSNT